MIAGAALWGLAIGQLAFAPLCDALGMRTLLRCAFIAHLCGVAVMMTARGFGQLVTGAAILSTANGIVEATCNPLVATLYPDRKAIRLSHFHFWFPGGIMIGGLAVFTLGSLGVHDWRADIALILAPTLIYGLLTWRETFPLTESRRSGIPVTSLITGVVKSPLMWLLLGLMTITASLELGPNRWIPSVLAAGGMPGVLILVFINGVMAALRWRAHSVLSRVPPTVVLLASVVVTGFGLALFGVASSFVAILLAAGVFALGVAFLWPMMVGMVAERVPRTGAVGLGLIAAVGAAFVGLVTTPAMGHLADRYLDDELSAPATLSLAHEVETRGPDLHGAPAAADLSGRAAVVLEAQDLEHAYQQSGRLPAPQAVTWLRRVIRANVRDDVTARAQAILRPAENAGGLRSFVALVPYAGLAAGAFLTLLVWDRRRGGYAAQVALARLPAVSTAEEGGRS